MQPNCPFNCDSLFISQIVESELEAVNKSYHACLTCLKDKESMLDDAHSLVDRLQAEARKLVEVMKQVSHCNFLTRLSRGWWHLMFQHSIHTVHAERCRFGAERERKRRPHGSIVIQG